MPNDDLLLNDELCRPAQELDPLSLIISAAEGLMYYFAGRNDTAIEQLHKALELDPDFFVAHWELGLAYEQKQMYEEALSEVENARKLSPENSAILESIGETYALSGRRSEAVQVLNQLVRLSKRQFVSPYIIAELNVALSANDQAFQWLERAFAERDNNLIYLGVDPSLRNIRLDPRYQDLLRRVGLSRG